MPNNEDTVKAAMTDPTKQSRIAKLITTLSGPDVMSVINAISGNDQDFTAELAQVQQRMAQIGQLQASVDQRNQQISQLNSQIQVLEQRAAQRESVINDLQSRIPSNPGNNM